MNAACPECRKPLLKTPSGFVCPDGHGKILNGEQARKLEVSQLGRAHRLKLFDHSYYTIEGQPGIWHKAPKADGELRASDGYLAFWFRRCPELERRIVDALGDQLAEAALSR